MDAPSAQTLPPTADSAAPEPWSRYFSAEGIYLRPAVDARHERLWRSTQWFLKWGMACALVCMALNGGSYLLEPPEPFWFLGAGFLLATYQLLGPYEVFIVLDSPALPESEEWERTLSQIGAVLLALLLSCGFLLVATATTWIPAILLRRRGWRVVYAPEYAPRRFRAIFSLRTLFMLLTGAAVLLGIVSALWRLGGEDALWPLVVLALLVGCGVSPLAWFLPRPVNWWGGGAAIGLLTGIAYWVDQAVHAEGMFILFGTDLAVCHCVALAAHRAGFRLLRLPEGMRR